MNSASVGDEVLPGPRIAHEKFRGQQVPLETVATATGENDVARSVRAAVRQRMHVIEGGKIELEW